MPDGTPPRRTSRAQDTARTRQDIIAAARIEFAEKGLTGASVNDIAARTRTSKPMIYYHFGSKEGLYAAVMDDTYGGLRDLEQSLDLDNLSPDDAMRRLVETTFDYHADNPDYVRLISVENLHHARHIAGSKSLAERNATVVRIVGDLLRRGAEAGVFRPGIDPIDLHWLISSTSFYRMSNRHTWGVIFQTDLQSPARRDAQRAMLVEVVLAYLRPGGPAASFSS